MILRRHVLTAGLAWSALPLLANEPDAMALLRDGGVVLAIRHALALSALSRVYDLWPRPFLRPFPDQEADQEADQEPG